MPSICSGSIVGKVVMNEASGGSSRTYGALNERAADHRAASTISEAWRKTVSNQSGSPVEGTAPIRPPAAPIE